MISLQNGLHNADVLREELPQCTVLTGMLAIDPLARSSTWGDLQAGKPTEVDYINGEVVKLAAMHGLRAPINRKLCALVHAAEASPRSCSHEALLAALRTAV